MRFYCPERECRGHEDQLEALLYGQHHLDRKLDQLMSASEDLKAAVIAEDATVDGAITAIVTYLKDIAGKVSGGVSAEDAEVLVADLNDHAASLSAATATLVAADPGAPVETPPVDETPVSA